MPGSSGALFLTGFMGSGKSTVGRVLARRLGRSFIDLDNLIEQREGRSIARIFSESGEEAFREAERRALAELPLEQGPVVATGGGCVLDEENRRLMARSGLRVWLKCPLAVLLRRIGEAGESEFRPLWAADRQKLGRLLEERTPVYAAAADLAVDASAEAGDCAAEIVRWLEARGT